MYARRKASSAGRKVTAVTSVAPRIPPADRRDHLMGTPLQPGEHPEGVGRVGRFLQYLPFHHDRRVGAEHQGAGHPGRLLPG
jgi:hypothetical protein